MGGGWVPLVPVDRGKAAEGGLRLTAVLGKQALRTHVQTLVSTPASSWAGLFHFSIFYLYLRQLNKVMKQNDFLLTLSVLAVRHVFWSQCFLVTVLAESARQSEERSPRTCHQLPRLFWHLFQIFVARKPFHNRKLTNQTLVLFFRS